MSEQRRKRTRTLLSRSRALARKTLGSTGTRSHGARAAMLGMALGVSASVSAAPTVDHRPAKAASAAPEQTATVKPAKRHHWFEVGKATWYGGEFNGRKTANGETFNENELTAAHRTLPLGSWIRVTNLRNNRSAMVRVTDRGPWVKTAVLDLSHAAAEKLGFSGTAKVRIEPVSNTDQPLTQVAQLSHEPKHDAAEEQ